MSLFLSTYLNKIDKKGRVCVPASFRHVLSSSSFPGIITFRSYKVPAIDGMSIEKMDQLKRQLDNFPLFSDEYDDLASSIFADAQLLPFDSEGRILFTDALLEHANFEDVAAFVGRGSTFQIWNHTAFHNYQIECRNRLKEKNVSLRKGEKDD